MLALVGEGKIKREDLVWREGMPEWVDAAQAGLFKDAPAPAPTAAPTPAPAPAAAPVKAPAPTRQVQAPAGTELPDYARMMRESRASIGPAPRTLVSSPYLRLVPPQWLQNAPADALWEIYRQQDVLWRDGLVVWACIIKANQAALSPGKEDVPASVVYSPHPWFDARLDQLGRIAQVLGELQGKQHRDPETAEFARMMFNDQNRAPRLPVPKAIFGEFPAFHTSVMVVRKHLPRGFLTNGMLPVLIKPQTTTATIILPSCYWSPLLLGAWDRGLQSILANFAAARQAAARGQQGPGPR
jgi:hypothetical protein